jgi:CRISPR-associated endonuclease/helicase Cas3
LRKPTKKAQGKSGTVAILFSKCPAKTYRSPNDDILVGRSVLEHCQIVGHVASELLNRLPAPLVARLFPPGSALVAACHDIGKVSPTFAKKLLSNTTTWDPLLYPELLGINASLESNWGGHAGVSQVAALKLRVGDFIPGILGQHHGFVPSVDSFQADAEVFGGEKWQEQRELLVQALKESLCLDWPKVFTFAQARAIAGLTSVSDWIGSGQHFENPAQDWQPKIKQALDEAGFVPAEFEQSLTFMEVFGFPARPAQEQFIDNVTGPGLYLLEAPMGIGKTEAALFAAYRLLAQGASTGIYFALPTQLTSNKIYDRFNRFLQVILKKDSHHKKSLLLHGSAWLLAETEMGEDGAPGGSWFNSSKRGLLAPFAVGTIDQALMAVMNVKHGFVRAFGLAGKVVILDEVHTYDAYTGTILDALVDGLRQLHCTVIILTATLNKSRRETLLGCAVQQSDYPLISALQPNEPLREIAINATVGQRVSVNMTSDELLAINGALSSAERGQQVLWIENTVKEAQQRYFDLAARCHDMGVECGLLHSRFTQTDRQNAEDKWVKIFGPAGWSDRQAHGRILIGTQVLEQSLDLDSDYLITRFAPTDMLLQRIGRLWRHTETPRHHSAECRVLVLGPRLSDAIEKPAIAFGATAWVYNPYVLCRSLEVWENITALQLPGDIRPMIESTYSMRSEDGPMGRWQHELEQGNRQRTGQRALQQFARVALAKDGKTLPESKAQTRYSEADNTEVLLLRALKFLPEEKASRLMLLSGEEILLPWQRGRCTKREWRLLSASLMRQVVSVRFAESPAPLSRSVLMKTGLQHCFYFGDPAHGEALLRLAIVGQDSDLRGYQGAPLNKEFRLTYRDDIGYLTNKIKD